ncbi:hypothetical protein [Egbenema bharatensis]|uniref:hypothetical protein n=1 Tax=Egbenema bharatensis TaxID=3463334 RepID=UPI003A845F7D
MKTVLKRGVLSLFVFGLALTGAVPASAQAIRLGDGFEVDLTTPRRREVQPRISSDGDRVNVEIYERPEPQTEIRINENQVEIQRREQPPRQRLDLSIPVE